MGRIGPVLAAAGVVTVLAAQSQTTFYAAFADAQEAARQGQWRTAAQALERAIKLRPVPAPRVLTYGNNLLADYYPYSLLARCRLELGDADAAAALLRLAEAKGEPASAREPVARRLPRHAEPAPARYQEAPVPEVPGPPKAAPPARHLEALVPEAPAPPKAAQPARHLEAPVPEAPAPPVFPGPRADPGPPEPPAVAAGPVRDAGPERLVPSPPRPAAAAAKAEPGAQYPRQLLPVRAPVPVQPLPQAFWIGLAAGLAVLAGWLGWQRRQGARPGTEPAPPSGPGPETMGPYRIVRLLGHGAFAATYLARHQVTGREVALKVLHPHRLHDPDFRRRFRQEAKLGALLEHPRLVRLLDPGGEEGSGWIALEYVPGPTLEAHLKERGRLPVAEAVAIVLGIAEAMAYAHARGVVHRDLKPANVILGEGGPKVMDLGIARDLDESLATTTVAFLGTPVYAAPEAQLAASVGPSADRYSLGVILFEMLAGQPPFQGGTPFAIMDQHRCAPAPDLAALAEVPPELARLVGRLLEKEPEQRPEDGELVAKLKRIGSSLMV